MAVGLQKRKRAKETKDLLTKLLWFAVVQSFPTTKTR